MRTLFHARQQKASEKRQGTKSREVWHPTVQERLWGIRQVDCGVDRGGAFEEVLRDRRTPGKTSRRLANPLDPLDGGRPGRPRTRCPGIHKHHHHGGSCREKQERAERLATSTSYCVVFRLLNCRYSPTIFILVINLATARALDLTVPCEVLAQARRVVE